MKFEFSTSAYIKDGQIMVRNRQQLQAEALASGLNEFEVVVRKKVKSRSSEQNKWYWACVTIIGNELGYERNQMHEIIKYRFLKSEAVDKKTGEVFEYLKSSAELTTTEFTEFMDGLIRWSAETFNIVLPMPNEQTSLTLLDHQK